MRPGRGVLAVVLFLMAPLSVAGAAPASVPPGQRGTIAAERAGTHEVGNIRTVFWNYGMVGDYPQDPLNVDLGVFHSLEVPKGSGMNYGEGFTPFVLAKIRQNNGNDAYVMETGYRERQGISPLTGRVMRFEPRPGYIQPDPSVNQARSPAISNDPRTWPDSWPDRLDDPNDPGWPGFWNGYFGKHPAADQESYTVMDDDFYDAWDFYPDNSDPTRRGLGLRIQVRGLQWAHPEAGNVVFWLYDITNEGTTDYDDNIIFGLYADAGVGGSQLSCDGVFESDDDNVYLDRSTTSTGAPLDVVYTWDHFGHGVDLSGPCSSTGYLGYVYLETPGNPFDAIDNDDDGITDEMRGNGPGMLIQGQQTIRDFVTAIYDLTKFERTYGPLEQRPAYKNGRWWTGDEDMDWDSQADDVGADGVADTQDTGELDGIPTEGEPNVDRTDLNESDQIGLSGFKMNRIHAGQGNPDPTVDNIVFYTDQNNWPQRLYEKFTDPSVPVRFDAPLVSNYNVGFLLASGPFRLKAGETERMSVALAYGADLAQLDSTVATVQQIYNANYRFAPDGSTATPMALALPGALNLRSLGRWVTAYLQPLGDFEASAIDVGSIRLHGNVTGASPVPVDPAAPSAIGDQNGDQIEDLMVKFDRGAVELTLSEGAAVPVTVTGTVAGQPFSGASTLKVLRAHITAPAAGAVVNAGTVTSVRWQVLPGTNVESVALLSSLDDGASWTLVASRIPNIGGYDWTVSDIPSLRARVAVVLVGSADATGYEVEGVLGMSEPFTIQAPVGVGDGSKPELTLHGVRPNPGHGAMRVHFSLADRHPARIEVLDVTGRRVMLREVGTLGAGQHYVELRSGLRAGIYLVRLTQGDQVRSVRAAVLE